jgi:RsmE family RNA methyltransferase
MSKHIFVVLHPALPQPMGGTDNIPSANNHELAWIHDPAEHHIICNVWRSQIGDYLYVLDTHKHTKQLVQIQKIDKKKMGVHVLSTEIVPQTYVSRLYVGACKPATMDRIVEACGYAGIGELHVVRCANGSYGGILQKKQHSLEKKLQETCRISKNPWVAKLFWLDFADMQAQLCQHANTQRIFMCHEAIQNTQTNGLRVLADFIQNKGISLPNATFFIGPESGFSDTEARLWAQNWGQHIVTLPHRIYSTESMAQWAISMLQWQEITNVSNFAYFGVE